MDPDDLVKAVVSWFTFEKKCRRANLVDERRLQLPIGEFLSANVNGTPHSEKRYASFVGHLDGGDNRTVDLCVQNQQAQGGNNPALNSIFEIKYIRYNNNQPNVPRQAIFNDLYRLHRSNSDYVRCQQAPFNRYFVIVGDVGAMNDFKQLCINANGRRQFLWPYIIPFGAHTNVQVTPWNITQDDNINERVHTFWCKAANNFSCHILRRMNITRVGYATMNGEYEAYCFQITGVPGANYQYNINAREIENIN